MFRFLAGISILCCILIACKKSKEYSYNFKVKLGDTTYIFNTAVADTVTNAPTGTRTIQITGRLTSRNMEIDVALYSNNVFTGTYSYDPDKYVGVGINIPTDTIRPTPDSIHYDHVFYLNDPSSHFIFNVDEINNGFMTGSFSGKMLRYTSPQNEIPSVPVQGNFSIAPVQ